MKIEVILSRQATGAGFAQDIRHKVAGAVPDVALIHYDCTIDADDLQSGLSGVARHVHGATSCLGAMSHLGHTTAQNGGGAAFLIYDPDGDYGTACAAFDGDARETAQSVVTAAVAAADRAGEAPDLVWLSTSPGQEESVLEGIRDILGADVPIIGGSAADNDISGGWAMFDEQATTSDGVLVTVMFPSTRLSFAYQNGYAPTAQAGTVTKADGRRILEIDGRPAAEVYARWTGQAAVAGTPAQDENILAQSTLWPLGREIGAVQGITQYLLAHPAGAHPDGSLSLFADVAEGEVLTQMTGDPGALADRAGRVAAMAATRDGGAPQIAGALMVYCGGCMLAVQDYMDRVVEGVQAALPDVPMLGTFTFGEQGPIQNSGSRHGNLMISCIAFER
ncbi:MAG: FIST C-terminal domain-containing protein [Pseudomonadota bacterium]